MRRNCARCASARWPLSQLLLVMVVLGLNPGAFAMQYVPQGPYSLSDPPLYMTNLTGTAATVVWQTLLPNQALSQPRSSVLDANTQAQRSEQAFFLLYDRDDPEQISNTLFVSILDDDGSFVAQKLFKIDENLDLARLHKAGIGIVIEADGGLSVSARN